MIWYFVPGRSDKNIGKALNDHCNLVKNEDDWIVTMDGDMMFLQPFWAKQLEDIIMKHGNKYRLFVPVTNRIASLRQRPFPEDFENFDMLHHKKVADKLYTEHYDEVADYTKAPAGLMLVFQKRIYDRIKFREKRIDFDTIFGRKMMMNGFKMGLMKGFYVFHGYRMGQENPMGYKSHLL